ncbi:unnamed protein product, partial [Brassica oleracea]
VSILHLCILFLILDPFLNLLFVCFCWKERNRFCGLNASLTFSLFSRILNENNASHRGIN